MRRCYQVGLTQEKAIMSVELFSTGCDCYSMRVPFLCPNFLRPLPLSALRYSMYTWAILDRTSSRQGAPEPALVKLRQNGLDRTARGTKVRPEQANEGGLF
jgi:hypothetical protein